MGGKSFLGRVQQHKYLIGLSVVGVAAAAFPVVILPAAGFGSSGIIAGSWAAASMGPAVTAGGWFSFAQALAAGGGFAAPTVAAIVAVPTAAGAVLDVAVAAPAAAPRVGVA